MAFGGFKKLLVDYGIEMNEEEAKMFMLKMGGSKRGLSLLT